MGLSAALFRYAIAAARLFTVEFMKASRLRMAGSQNRYYVGIKLLDAS